MFGLKEQSVMIIDVNPRMELHGEERILATDIKVSMKVPNKFLDNFDRDLRTAFFYKGEQDQGDMLNRDDPDHLPNLKFPLMTNSIAWDLKGAGYRVVIPSLLGKKDIILIQAEIDKFKFEPQEGGTVIVSFRVVAHPNEKELGELCGHIQQEVELTLEPPSPEEQARMEMNDAA